MVSELPDYLQFAEVAVFYQQEILKQCCELAENSNLIFLFTEYNSVFSTLSFQTANFFRFIVFQIN